MKDIIGRCYDIKFMSDGKPIETTIKSVGKEMSLHDIRLELYNDYKNISKLEISSTYFLKGERY